MSFLIQFRRFASYLYASFEFILWIKYSILTEHISDIPWDSTLTIWRHPWPICSSAPTFVVIAAKASTIGSFGNSKFRKIRIVKPFSTNCSNSVTISSSDCQRYVYFGFPLPLLCFLAISSFDSMSLFKVTCPKLQPIALSLVIGEWNVIPMADRVNKEVAYLVSFFWVDLCLPT